MTPLETTLPLFSEMENIEQWRSIEYFPNYAVSDLGRVKRLTTRTSGKAGAILSPVVNIGYPFVALYDRKKGTKTFSIHRLVAAAFLPKIDGKNEVNHIDGDRGNPRLSNLEYVSRSENQIHAFKTGLQK